MLIGTVFGGAGLVAAFFLLSLPWTWWEVRSYVPVEARLLKVTLEGSRSRGKSAMTFVRAEYSFQYRGQKHTSTIIGGDAQRDGSATYSRLRPNYESGTEVTAWVNPKDPQQSVLNREFFWLEALLKLLFSVTFIALGAAAFTLRATSMTVPANGTLVAVDHGPYLFTAVVALFFNLMTLPLALVAVAEMVHGIRLVHAVALLSCAAGFALAGLAWRLYEKRWLLGFPVLERLQGGAVSFKVRIHFHPGLGVRCAQGQASYRVAIAIRQLQHEKRNTSSKRHSVKVLWFHDVGEIDVEHGEAAIDVSANAPSWRAPSESAYPAFWEVTMCALDNKVTFRLGPYR